MPRLTPITPELLDYAIAHGPEPESYLTQLRTLTAKRSDAQMQIGIEQGAFMRLLVAALGARRCIEVGVYTGYSALCVALGLPGEGRIIACDVDPETAEIAREYFEKAGLSAKFDQRLAPALETLDQLLAEGESGGFDFAFLDADKENYPTYYERLLALLRPSGVLLVDNVLWGGAVVDLEDQRPTTLAVRRLNDFIRTDERVDQCLLPIGDGVMMVRKR